MRPIVAVIVIASLAWCTRGAFAADACGWQPAPVRAHLDRAIDLRVRDLIRSNVHAGVLATSRGTWCDGWRDDPPAARSAIRVELGALRLRSASDSSNVVEVRGTAILDAAAQTLLALILTSSEPGLLDDTHWGAVFDCPRERSCLEEEVHCSIETSTVAPRWDTALRVAWAVGIDIVHAHTILARRVHLDRAATDSAGVEVVNVPGWIVTGFRSSPHGRPRPIASNCVLRDDGADVKAVAGVFECEDLKCE